jgi:hypothetical protein
MCRSKNDHSKPACSQTRAVPLFPLGRIVATPAVLEHLTVNRIDALTYLLRHQCGEWGEVPPEDARENDRSVQNGLRVLSAYTVAGQRIWIITEWDRSVTTMLFPHEY